MAVMTSAKRKRCKKQKIRMYIYGCSLGGTVISHLLIKDAENTGRKGRERMREREVGREDREGQGERKREEKQGEGEEEAGREAEREN